MIQSIIDGAKKTFTSSCCIVCGKPIVGTYMYDKYGNRVCEQHKSQVIQCMSCDRLCTKTTATYVGKERFICKHCADNLPSEQAVNEIAAHIRKVLKNVGIDGIPPFTIHQVEVDKLQKSSDDYCEGQAVCDEKGYSIYVLKYLSKTSLACVLAHEMLHLWQYKNNISPRQDICEGFCNLGSYEILKSINTDVARTRLENLANNPDPIYGDGFRKVKAVYDTGGWQAVIIKIKNTKK